MTAEAENYHDADMTLAVKITGRSRPTITKAATLGLIPGAHQIAGPDSPLRFPITGLNAGITEDAVA
jgi:hypothetical protein